jgi:tetratricopeptide (TPR) repeat protein
MLFRSLREYPVPSLLTLLCLGLIGFGGAVAGRHLWAESHYRAAQQALDQWDFPQAQAHLARCLEVWPSSAETHLLAARTARRATVYDEAERHLKEYQRLSGVAEVLDLERALLRAQRGDLARVEGVLLSFVQQDHPDAVLILEALTRGYMKTYQLPRAYHCLKLWLKRQPDEVQALLWRAEVLERQSSFQGAMADYRRVIELDPDRDEARLHFAGMLLQAHQPEDALEHFQYLHRRQPENSEVLLGLARCQHLLGRPDDARMLLDTVLNDLPSDAGALSERGRLALEMGQIVEAEDWLRKSLALAPYDRETTYSLYLCLQQRRKVQEAKQYLDKLDDIGATLGHLRELTRRIGATPHDPALRHEAGVIFLRSGQTTEGLRWLQSALQEDPHHGPTHQVLAEHYEQIGDSARAAWHRRQALPGQVEVAGVPPGR